MRILLLGNHGLLGSEFQKLFSPDYEVIGLGHQELDITDFSETIRRIEEIKPDFVINTAGYTKVDLAETEEEKAFLVNASAVGNLAELSKKLKFPLLHFSTDYVFSGEKNEYREDDIRSPINVYGRSKALGEELLVNRTPYHILIRTSWLFGPGGKNFVSSILNLAKTEPVLKIVNDQFGKPTYAPDLVKACLRFLQAPVYGIYHIVNEDATSWFEFAKTILAVRGIKKDVVPITSEELARPAKRPHRSILVNSKLPHLRPWREAINDYLALPNI